MSPAVRQVVGVASHQHGIGAGLGNCECHLAPQAAADAGDEQTLAVEAKAVEHGYGKALRSCLNIIPSRPNHHQSKPTAAIRVRRGSSGSAFAVYRDLGIP